tara:strand:- start:1581 stop:1778 length:198 start_codon:yes stop_codon:yes gene_type:complete
MTYKMYKVADLVDMDIHKEIIHKEEKKLSYLEWRQEMERQYDVMPRRYFREAHIMYQEYKNETDD